MQDLRLNLIDYRCNKVVLDGIMMKSHLWLWDIYLNSQSLGRENGATFLNKLIN